ncbi:MAG: type VI secretion system baseplate subunit TssE [Deltaproteobacteria bacterium]|jgi:type VI secretion system protein|nr:type VI secretion system baseplate subunit TssE [Deltaproteobacteria bacterium]
MRLRLLERLKAAERGESLKAASAEELTLSLEKHLSLILNTHQGTSRSAPDFGMPDFASVMGSSDLDNIRELAGVIAQVIAKYEPRISNVEVTYNQGNKESGILDFSLSCSMMINDIKRELLFNTIIAPDGSVRIRR